MWKPAFPITSEKQLCEPGLRGLLFAFAIVFCVVPAAGVFFFGAVGSALAVNEDAPWLSQEASRCHRSRIIPSLGLLCGVELGQFYSVRGVPDSYDAVFSAGDDDRSVGVGCRSVNVV